MILDLGVTFSIWRVLPALLLFVIDCRDNELTTGLLETTRIVTVVILFGGVEWLHSLVALELFKQFSLAFSRLL